MSHGTIKNLSIVDALTPKKTPNRKHKKHNHHHRTHKKKKPNNDPSTDDDDGDDAESDAIDVTNDSPNDTAVMLPADLNITPPVLLPSKSHSGVANTPPTPVASSSRNTPSSGLSTVAANALNASVAAAAKRKRIRNNKADSATSSEEERWLDAIQSGKLEQVDDEMKKLKDPKLMTARQRAMYERSTAAAAASSAVNTTTVAAAPTDDHSKAGRAEASLAIVDEQLFALPSGYKETKVLSAEDIEKALVKSQKRKQLADEKREKNKRKTMERLLKKKDYKAAAKANKSRPTVVEVPMISWRSGPAGTSISFPPGVEPLPLFDGRQRDEPAAETVSDGPTPVPCGRVPCAICGEPKRYNCSRTHVPLCSFECYKENVAALKHIMC